MCYNVIIFLFVICRSVDTIEASQLKEEKGDEVGNTDAPPQPSPSTNTFPQDTAIMAAENTE